MHKLENLVPLSLLHFQLQRLQFHGSRRFRNGKGFGGDLEHFAFLAQVLHQFKISAHRIVILPRCSFLLSFTLRS